MGVGASMNANAVKWGLAGNICVAWVLTVPMSALMSTCFHHALVWGAPGLGRAPERAPVGAVP
jgi:phosphate/sulfate permease